MFSRISSKILLARNYKICHSISRSDSRRFSSKIHKLGDQEAAKFSRVNDAMKVTGRRFMADSRRLEGCWWIDEKGKKISEKVSSNSVVNVQRFKRSHTAFDGTFQGFISSLKSVYETAALYKGQAEHLITYCSAFSALYQMVVHLAGWIFGVITLQTIFNELTKLMAKVDKIQEKVDKIEEKAERIEKKLKKAPLQPPASAQFRWPWPLVNKALKKDVSVSLNC